MRLPLRLSAPRPRRRRSWIATLLALGALGPAAAVEVVTINTPVYNSLLSLPPGWRLNITATGELLAQGDGTSIQIAGNTENYGLIRTGWNTQSIPVGLTFLGSSGPNVLSMLNAQDARVEAAHLTLFGTSFTSVGRLTTGALTVSNQLIGSPQAATWSALVVGNGSLLQITEGSAPNGLWENYGGVRVDAGGRLNIDGSARMLTLPAASPPTPFSQVFEIGAPLVATGVPAGYLFLGERGGLDLHAGYELRNGGVIENTGFVHVLPGSAIRNALGLPPPTPGMPQGEIYNSSTLLIGVEGPAPAAPLPLGTLAVLENAGSLSSANGVLRIGGQGHLSNAGRIEISGGRAEVLTMRWSVAGASIDMRGLWTNADGSSTFIGNGATVRVDGDFLQYGGRLESQGLLEVGPTGRVQLGGVSELQAGSGLLVAGDMRVTGQLTLLGASPGPLPMPPAIATVATDGLFSVSAGASVRQTSSQFTNEGGLTLEVGSQWISDHGDGGNRASFINMATGHVSIAADWQGSGRITNRGSFALEPDARLSTLSFAQESGLLYVHDGATLETVADDQVAGSGRLTMTGGLLKGNGRINGDLFLEGGVGPAGPQHLCGNSPTPGVACFTPGNSPGTMEISGLLVLGQGSILELEVDWLGQGQVAWDRVLAGSMSFESGALVRVLIDPEMPAIDFPSLDLLTCTTGDCSLQAASFEVSGGHGGEFVFNPDGSLSFALAPVPEPANWALLAAGLAALGLWRRRVSPPDERA